MRTPSGNNTTPETPLYTGPEGYASTKLEVQSSPSYTPTQEGTSYSVTRKGYTPGTFVIGGLKDQNDKERPVIQGLSRPRVGNEARNLEREELLALGRAAKKAGIEIKIDEKGNIESIDIPEEYTSNLDEDEPQKEEKSEFLTHIVSLSIEFADLKAKTEAVLPYVRDMTQRAVLMSLRDSVQEAILTSRYDPNELKIATLIEKVKDLREELKKIGTPATPADKEDGKMKLLEEILDLTSEVDTELDEARRLEEQIFDGAVLADLKNSIERIRSLFANLRRNPSAHIKKQFDEAFAEYQNDSKKKIEEFILKHPKPFVTASTATPITPAAATTPAAAIPIRSSAPLTPEQREKLNIDHGWPDDKVFYKEGDEKNKAGWYVNDKGSDHFSENQQRWETEHKRFTDAFEEYKELVADLSPESVQTLRPLIEIKNRTIEAVRRWKIDPVTAERKKFEAALSKWKKHFSLQRTLESFEKTTQSAEKVKELLEHDHEHTQLDAEKAKAEQLYNLLKQASASGTPARDEDVSRLKAHIEEFKKLIQSLEEKNKKLGRGILRPIKVTEANKHQKIKVIGKPEVTLEQYSSERTAKERHEELGGNMTEITDTLLSRWHELADYYQVGDHVREKDLSKLTIFITYDRMFRKNEHTFLGLYSTPEYDKSNNSVRYVSNRRFQMGTEQEKDAIRDVFRKHGLELLDQTWEERKVFTEKEVEEKKVTTPSYKETFRPIFKHKVSLKNGKIEVQEEKDAMKRVDDIGHTERMAHPTIFADIGKYESLKSERQRLVIRHASFERVENHLDEIIADIKADPDSKHLQEEFYKTFSRYEKEVTPFIEGRKEEISLGMTLEERAEGEERKKKEIEAKEKKTETLKKIDSILNRRIAEVTKKAELKWGDALQAGNGRIRLGAIILASVIGATAVYYGLNETASAEQTPQRTEQSVEQEKPWREYVASYAEDLQKDIDANVPMRALISKYAPSLVNKDKPASIDNVLGMDGYKILNTENVYNMSDEQQTELSNFIRSLENIHQAIAAKNQTEARLRGVPYDNPNDLHIGPQTIMKDYIQKIIRNVGEAGK